MLERPHKQEPTTAQAPKIEELSQVLSQRPISDPEVRTLFDLYVKEKNNELDTLESFDKQRALDIHEDLADMCQLAGLYQLAFDHYDVAADAAKSFGDADREEELRDKATHAKSQLN